MRGRWRAIHDGLMHSISTQAAEREFRKNRSESLKRFESPLALVGYLTSRSGDPDEKNDIYRDLVNAAQSRDHTDEFAVSILWLGLWPALDAIYGRKLRFFSRNSDELISALSEHFAAAIGSADLARIRRLAATLTMNTERRLVDDLRKRWKIEARLAALPEDDRLARKREVSPAFLQGRSRAQEIAAIRARLIPIVGEDVDLVLAIVLGEPQDEAGERLGLTHDVARKRYQRALRRIRDSEGVVVPFPPQNLRL